MIGNNKYTVRYTHFGTLQRDFSENVLNLILEYNEYISTWLHLIGGNYGPEKYVCGKFILKLFMRCLTSFKIIKPHKCNQI